MKRLKIERAFLLLTLLPAILLLFGCGAEEKEEVKGAAPSGEKDYYEALGIAQPKAEIKAFNFTAESLNGGEKRSMGDFRGKVVFLNFWATWCGPCKVEVKDIDKLYDTLKDEDFTVMAVDIQESRDTIRSFMRSYRIDFPVYLDPDGRIASLYAINAIPTTFIIDPDGKIVGRAIGPRSWASDESVGFMRSLMGE